ncbi:MAG: GTP-binding protein [Lachnospiraceae bacterium]|nr:GTP-binding protein [Lachnospiraceae bacterium]
MTKIDIVSGFLGAGKTTLIKKLLSEALKGEQVVLIENEFGEIGVDGGFLKEAGIEITEMNSGCICCSLVGDFATALKEVLEKYHPERILIEPSGVGKLSDVMAAVQNAGLHDAALNSAVAVVDASKAKMYIKNFGEFFINQIEHAGTIILSRTGNISEDKLNKAIELIKEHNDKATIVTTPWELVEGKAILETIEGAKDLEKELLEEVMKHHAEHEHEYHHHEHEHHHDHDEHEHHHHEHKHDDHDEHDHHHEHDHDEHDHEHEHEHGDHCNCGCGHDHGHEGHHHADEVFDSIGFETAKTYSKADIERFLEDLEDDDKYGMVLRSKGIVASTDSDEWIHFDYTPGEVNVRYGKADVTGKIVVIGAQIKEEAIKELFA